MENAKITVKIVLIWLILVTGIITPAFSQQIPLGDVKGSMDEFAGSLAKSLPFNSSMGLNWADAYIGQFLGIPPHFGVGFSFGYTTMDSGRFTDLLKNFTISLPDFLSDFGGFPVPGYAAEARIGGFFLPFDAGFKFGYMPLKPNYIDKLDYLLVGGDVRYALIKGNVIIPKISIGVGFNYMSGGIGQSIGQSIKYGYNPNDENDFIEVSKPKVSIDWATSSLDFKAQISKSLLIITPYLGIGASNGWSKAGYGVETTVTDSGGDLEAAKDALKQFGIYDLDQTGFSSEVKESGWSFRVFGGLSFNITILRLELTGLYNFVDGNYGLTMGARIQI